MSYSVCNVIKCNMIFLRHDTQCNTVACNHVSCHTVRCPEARDFFRPRPSEVFTNAEEIRLLPRNKRTHFISIPVMATSSSRVFDILSSCIFFFILTFSICIYTFFFFFIHILFLIFFFYYIFQKVFNQSS